MLTEQRVKKALMDRYVTTADGDQEVTNNRGEKTMKKMKKTTTFLARVCLALSILAAAFVADVAAQGEPVGPVKPVVVVNQPSAPVPVTGTVGITTNQPVPVTGTVEITTNQPVPVTGSVSVTTTEGPLLVSDINNIARQPFQRIMFLPAGPSSFVVPAAKRLVIEFASMNTSVDTGCRVIALTIQTTLDGTNAGFSLPPTHAIVPGRNFDTVGQPVSIYADPGTQVTFSTFTQSVGSCNLIGNIAVSGYLVDVP